MKAQKPSSSARNKLMDHLAQKAAESLHRKKKGILLINAFLRDKSLPEVESKTELELEKARQLVKNKHSRAGGHAKEEKIMNTEISRANEREQE